MKELISVIVPVYNSERYIYSCIESVLNQTHSAFEVLLIEDGSEDSSLVICEALQKKDKRIRLIRQEHKGVSVARNRGIDEAKGKYMFFLDSDDLIHPQLLESLYRLQEETRATITTEYIHYGKNGDFQSIVVWNTDSDSKPGNTYLDNKEAMKRINGPFFYEIHGKMILHDALNNLRFREELSNGEDTLFAYQLMANGADIAVLYCDWYYYRKHEGGVSANNNLSPRVCWDRYRVDRYICNCEMKNGRKTNAIYREWKILYLIVDWYNIGKMRRDESLTEYVKILAKREKNLKIFRLLYWWMKLYYYLLLYCYPLLKVIQKLLPKKVKMMIERGGLKWKI